MDIAKNTNRFMTLLQDEARCSKELLNFISNKSDFLRAPASTIYHCSYTGGLVEHSLNVYDTLVSLTQHNNLHWGLSSSPLIIGLLHDICKANYYKPETRNVKQGNIYVQKLVYSISDSTPIGVHGDKSLFLLQQLGISLTAEEAYCIRYHMGPYEGKEVLKSLSEAQHKCPNILWVRLADEIATLQEDLQRIAPPVDNSQQIINKYIK